jgi:ATP-dependent Clp protease ATP-binding subunit ClpC
MLAEYVNSRLNNRATDRLLNAILLAQNSKSDIGSERFDTRHFLLGLFREGSGVAYHVLKNFDVDEKGIVEQCRVDIDSSVDRESQQTDISDEVLVALDATKAAVVRFGHNYHGTEHLLIGLMTSKLKSFTIIENMGIDPSSIRAEVHALLGHEYP